MLDQFIARYERQDDQLWRAHVEDAPELYAAGRSLSAVQERIRLEMAQRGLIAELIDQIDLAKSSQKAVDAAKQARLSVAGAIERSNRLTAVAISKLVADGLSLRDVATILGMSHTRVQQLLRSEEQYTDEQARKT